MTLHAHIDPFSGAAGDMLLASCLDLSPNPAELLSYVKTALRMGMPEIADEFDIKVQRVWRGGMGSIAASHVVVWSKWGEEGAPVPKNHHQGRREHVVECDTGASGDSGDDDVERGNDDEGHSHQHEHEHRHEHQHEHQHHSQLEEANTGASTSSSAPTATSGRPSAGNATDETDAAHNSTSHDHSHIHNHNHSHSHTHDGLSTGAPLRSLPDIRRLLEESDPNYIPPRVATLAEAVFTVLAIAEASVHGVDSLDAVHFHEVGAIDSIVDTIGTLLAMHRLGIDLGSDTRPPSVSCGALPAGSGSVWTQHGQLPVPAFATMKLLVGMPMCPGPGAKSGTVTGELVTPTGAALLRVLTGVEGITAAAATTNSRPSSFPNFTPRGIGVGAGTKDFVKFPNVLRIIVGDTIVPDGKKRRQTDVSSTTVTDDSIDTMPKALDSLQIEGSASTEEPSPATGPSKTPETGNKWQSDIVTHIVANIDDMTPEHLSHATDVLLQSGALDVWTHPIMMKKGRVAQSLHCLCHSDADSSSNHLLEKIFRHTTTLGVRIERNVERVKLKRKFITVLVPCCDTEAVVGEVAVKLGFLGEDLVSCKAEYDDCAKLSATCELPVQDIARRAEHLAKHKLELNV